jgi:hypothetical protein
VTGAELQAAFDRLQLDDEHAASMARGAAYRRFLVDQITDDECEQMIKELINRRTRSETMVKTQRIRRATFAYFKRCRADGLIPQEPRWDLSAIEGRHVVLRSVNGELARYRITPSGGLRYVHGMARVS